MAITVIRTAPDPSSFTALAVYQSETPDSLTEPEVLHYSSPVETAFTPAAASPFASPSVTVYVTSKVVVFWSEEESKGLTIPYVNISLHAAQTATGAAPARIYMQLDHAAHLIPESTTNGNAHASGEDEDMSGGLVEIHVVPNDESTLSAFYDALCACASLHPDPQFDEEDTFMSGDWITAESGQFEDAEAEDGELEEGSPTKWRRTE